MKRLKKADLIDLCHAYEQVILNAVADMAEGMSNADIQYNIYKDMQRIQLEFFGEVM